MNTMRAFVFKNYMFDPEEKTLKLYYGYDDVYEFCETYTFNFEFVDYDKHLLDAAIQTLFFVAGVSYYKAFLTPTITIQKGNIDTTTANFLSKTYQKGLGEFFYINNLDPLTPIEFPAHETNSQVQSFEQVTPGLLTGIGGGKDSLVSVELLRKSSNRIATWSVGHRPQLEPLVTRIGLPHFWVDRKWDPLLLKLNDQGAYNGHIPISAILASVGVIVGILTGYHDVVVSNEQSANEDTLTYRETPINHQYSKTSEFEYEFQKHLEYKLNSALNYYSFLRPLSELHIAEIFAKTSFDKYQDVFSSCNKAFTHDSHRLYWDATCPKCAFIFLAFTPFISREKLEALFDGKNLLLDKELTGVYQQLLGIEGDKPLECIGEVRESRVAMAMAQEIYPDLQQIYSFELDSNYDYRKLFKHNMPTEIFNLLKESLS